MFFFIFIFNNSRKSHCGPLDTQAFERNIMSLGLFLGQNVKPHSHIYIYTVWAHPPPPNSIMAELSIFEQYNVI